MVLSLSLIRSAHRPMKSGHNSSPVTPSLSNRPVFHEAGTSSGPLEHDFSKSKSKDDRYATDLDDPSSGMS